MLFKPISDKQLQAAVNDAMRAAGGTLKRAEARQLTSPDKLSRLCRRNIDLATRIDYPAPSVWTFRWGDNPMKINLSKLVLAFGLGFFLTACSSGGDVKVLSSAPVASLPAQPSIRLVVNAVAKDSGDVLADLRVAVLGQLEATGRYSKVSVGPEPSDLVIMIDIVKYAKVTTGERILVGALAGRNRVGTSVKVVQSSTNATVKSFEANGESAAHPFSSESGLSDAIREVAKQISAAS